MMKTFKLYILLLSLAAAFISCRKETPGMIPPEDYSGENFSSVFESFWTGMNHNYLFWDIDTTDWDKVYNHYQPLFHGLNIHDHHDINKGIDYFEEMTAGLIDGHFSISFKNASHTINPSREQRKNDGRYHDPIPSDHFNKTVPSYYLDKNYRQGLSETGYGKLSAISGTIEGDILYLHFSNFLFGQLGTDDPVAQVLDYFFNRLKNTEQLKGIIIDVRSNGGGSMADLRTLLSNLINGQVTVAYFRGKMGEGRLDYTPWTPFTVTPASSNKIEIPVIALADLYSASCSELMAMGIAVLPNGYVIGERTWGAQGPLAENFIYNGGQFSTPFMELVYTSSLMTKYADGTVYEGIGFPSDREVKYDGDALNIGKDVQLEAAIRYIHSGY